jgi:hypothetical protein
MAQPSHRKNEATFARVAPRFTVLGGRAAGSQWCPGAMETGGKDHYTVDFAVLF